MKKLRRVVLGAGAVIVLGVAGAWYWHRDTLYPSTDDAYVQAHVVSVAAEVSGKVAQVFVHDQQPVEAGAPLFALDATPFKLKVQQAEAALSSTQSNAAADQAAVQAAEAAVNASRVQLDNARINTARAQRLRKQGYASAQQYDDTRAVLKNAVAQLKLSHAKLVEARITAGSDPQNTSAVREAKAVLRQAQWDLEQAHVAASCSGRVASMTLRPGDSVQAGRSPFKLVCGQEWWVNANYKETDFARIRPGQPATITVDMYPGHVLKGRVVAINPAAGSAFSLLPPENATGNWVKVTQRVPVRVRVLDPDPRHPLRVGTSSVVTVDTSGLDAE